MLEHGGRLHAAARQWGIPLAEWLDLSTGIAPWPYPVQINAAAWQRLPEDEDGLIACAARYYGHPAPLPLPGSQAAIQWLPRLLPPGRAVLPAPTYGEYAPAWRAAGHRVSELPYAELVAGDIEAEVIMLASPNNPTGDQLTAADLRRLAQRQAARGGWLVLDAAFADAADTNAAASLTAEAGTTLPRLIVLRSLGKFFGLAGARVGFCCAAEALQTQLAAALGPWAVSHPSRLAAQQALTDRDWQAQQHARLASACAQLGELLASHGLHSYAGGNCFRYVPMAQAENLYALLARRGILVRRFGAPAALRFGLPGTEPGWQALASALSDWNPA